MKGSHWLPFIVVTVVAIIEALSALTSLFIGLIYISSVCKAIPIVPGPTCVPITGLRS